MIALISDKQFITTCDSTDLRQTIKQFQTTFPTLISITAQHFSPFLTILPSIMNAGTGEEAQVIRNCDIIELKIRKCLFSKRNKEFHLPFICI